MRIPIVKSNEYRFNECDLYVALGILYLLQDILYPAGLIAQAIQMAIIIWGIIYAVPLIGNFRKQPKILKASTLLVIMYCVYGIIEIVFPHNYIVISFTEPVRAYGYLQNALNSFLPIFVFYRFYKQGLLTQSKIELYTYAFLILFILRFYHTQSVFIERALINHSDREEFTNNTGYSFLYIIPMLFFIRKTVIKFILLALTGAFLILCMKRGAIIIGGSAIIYFLIFQIRHSRNVWIKSAVIFLSGLFLMTTIWYILDMMSTSDYFMYRIEQTKAGDSSARDVLYADLLHELKTDPSLAHFIFGRGANATIGIAENYAHQDWLELMTNNGLIGIALGVFFFYALFHTAHKYRYVLGSTYYTVFIMLSCMMFVQTFFSMIIYQLPKCATILIGFMTGYAQHANRIHKSRFNAAKGKRSLMFR